MTGRLIMVVFSFLFLLFAAVSVSAVLFVLKNFGRVKGKGKKGKPLNGEILKLIEILGPIDERAENWKRNLPEKCRKKLTITAREGFEIVADCYAAAEKSHLWAVFAHAYKGYRTEMDKFAMHYHGWGFNCVVPDMRGHGDSGGKWIGMGAGDADDLVLWAEKILEEDPEAVIVFHGQSMGAAAVVCAAGKKTLPSAVACVVEDSSFASVTDLLTFMLQTALPGKMRFVVSPFMGFVRFYSRLICGFSQSTASPAESLSKTVIPVMFIHGEKDRTVPVSSLDILVKAHKGKHEVLRFPECGHIMAVAAEEEKYFEEVRAFVFAACNAAGKEKADGKTE